MGKESVRIGLIGAGRAGMIHGRHFAYQIPRARVSAVSDQDLRTAQNASAELGAGYYTSDFMELLTRPDVDAVVVSTPTQCHRDIAVAAATAGKHILCEKPMAMTEAECTDMIMSARENGVLLQIGFMRRFDESFCRAKEIIESGEIGRVVLVKSLTRGPSTPRNWMYDLEKSNGPLAEVNSHDIDTIRWLTGSEVASAYALAGNYRCPDARERYPDFYDTVLLSARMEDGSMAGIDGAQGVQYGYDARVDVLGTRGCVQIGGLRQGTVLSFTRAGGMAGDTVKSWTSLFQAAYRAQDQDFVDCILQGRAPRVAGADGREAVRVVHAGNESIRLGKAICLREGERHVGG